MKRRPRGAHLEEDTRRRAERAHYELLSALYLEKRQEIAGASLFTAGDIRDPEWNHAALFELEPPHVAPRLAEIREYYRSRDLSTTIELSPHSSPPDLEARCRAAGFETRYLYTWHFLVEDSATPAELPESADIRVVRTEDQMGAFIEVFESVYSVDVETGEPEELSPGYRRALWDSFRHRRGDLEVVHYLATLDDVPAGATTSIHGLSGPIRAVSGLYNLAVLPAYRRRGLGAALVRRRAADALALGQEIVFLQTERESVERRLHRHGFEPGFVTLGLTEQGTMKPAGRPR